MQKQCLEVGRGAVCCVTSLVLEFRDLLLVKGLGLGIQGELRWKAVVDVITEEGAAGSPLGSQRFSESSKPSPVSHGCGHVRRNDDGTFSASFALNLGAGGALESKTFTDREVFGRALDDFKDLEDQATVRVFGLALDLDGLQRYWPTQFAAASAT